MGAHAHIERTEVLPIIRATAFPCDQGRLFRLLFKDESLA